VSATRYCRKAFRRNQVDVIIEFAPPACSSASSRIWRSIRARSIATGCGGSIRPSRKAHPALLVDDLDGLRQRLSDAGYSTVSDEPLEGFDRFYTEDPFGNRIECLWPTGANA